MAIREWLAKRKTIIPRKKLFGSDEGREVMVLYAERDRLLEKLGYMYKASKLPMDEFLRTEEADKICRKIAELEMRVWELTGKIAR